MLNIKSLPLGPLQTNCYVVYQEGFPDDTWIIDPSMWADSLIEYLRANSLTPSRIMLTHGHGDHIGGIDQIKRNYPESIICCPKGEEDKLLDSRLNLSEIHFMPIVTPAAEEILSVGMKIPFGDNSCQWQIFDTSGHTLGGMSFYYAEDNVVFTGDALFYRSIGRTDLPDSNHSQLIKTIKENLLTLPDETRAYPGHGLPTTIRGEREQNPFL